jgi:hypothetical protein
MLEECKMKVRDQTAVGTLFVYIEVQNRSVNKLYHHIKGLGSRRKIVCSYLQHATPTFQSNGLSNPAVYEVCHE